MIHYIYRIDFLCGEQQGRYYLGKRTYHWKNIENDSYAGSGNFCSSYYKKYGKIKEKTYRKTIIEINESLLLNEQREADIIGDLWKTDPLCMNLCPGGGCSSGSAGMKRVVQYDLDGTVINIFESIADASNELKICASSISKCCSGNPRRKIVGGFVWRYDGDAFDKFIVPKYKHSQIKNYKKVNQYNINGVYLKTWNDPYEISKYFGYDKLDSTLMVCLNHTGKSKTAHGYRWEFYNGDIDNIEPLNRVSKYSVKQYTLNGEFIKEYISCCSAAKEIIGNHHGEKIKKCAEGLIESAFGFKWEFSKNR